MASKTKASAEKTGFSIFRGATAAPLVIENYQGVTPVVADALARLDQAGVGEGADLRTLFEVPGFSLTIAWFKSGFPLPLHSHQADCMYYITGGSLTLGTEQLGRGDGFFVPANTPYTYKAGPQGVEILEFRHHGCNDIKFRVQNAAYWDKTVKGMGELVARWRDEARPDSVTPVS